MWRTRRTRCATRLRTRSRRLPTPARAGVAGDARAAVPHVPEPADACRIRCRATASRAGGTAVPAEDPRPQLPRRGPAPPVDQMDNAELARMVEAEHPYRGKALFELSRPDRARRRRGDQGGDAEPADVAAARRGSSTGSRWPGRGSSRCWRRRRRTRGPRRTRRSARWSPAEQQDMLDYLEVTAIEEAHPRIGVSGAGCADPVGPASVDSGLYLDVLPEGDPVADGLGVRLRLRVEPDRVRRWCVRPTRACSRTPCPSTGRRCACRRGAARPRAATARGK